jgi:hypothetical protein
VKCEICKEHPCDCTCGEEAATRYADALIAIVGRPWHVSGWSDDVLACPGCGWDEIHIASVGHADDCAWLIAARATGIAD